MWKAPFSKYCWQQPVHRLTGSTADSDSCIVNNIVSKAVMGNVQDVEVGPIWSQAHAEEVAQDYIRNNPHFEWTGHWNTTIPGEMSTIQIRRRETNEDTPPNSFQDGSQSFFPRLESSLESFSQLLDDRMGPFLSSGVSTSVSTNLHRPNSSVSREWEILNADSESSSDDEDDVFSSEGASAPQLPVKEESSSRENDASTCSEIRELKAMFPNVSEEILLDILEENNYNFEKTTEDLLEIEPNETKINEKMVRNRNLDHKKDAEEKPKAATKSNVIPIPTCPVCYEALKPPKRIFQCTSGHLVCETCKSQPMLRGCPTCRQPIMGRATAMEQLLADLQHCNIGSY